MATNVLLVDDNRNVATALRAAFAADRRFGAFYYAQTAADGLRCLQERAVQTVILDLHLPDAEGAQLIPRLRQAGAQKVIIYTASSELPEGHADLDVDAVFTKGAVDELLDAAS